MPNYNYDPSSAVASFEVFPKDEYEVQIGEPKAFIKQSGEGDKAHDSYGIRFPLIIKEGAYAGKKMFYSTYLHSEGGQSFAKRFQMAALGYGKGKPEEDRFNNDMRGKDWSFDPETGGVGDAWREFVGKRIIVAVDVSKNTRSGDDQQQFTGFRSIAS